ncbi:LemA family protein [Mailhella sp.]|uniref:LemA family protein n=1 Tax=Mailhella sp. TaxID=1981029 RepID=UPI004063A832
MIAFGIVIAVLLIVAVVLIAMYNGMVRGRNLAEEAWSGIDVQLKRRHDLIPNLVSTVQGYAAHEQDVLKAVAEARSASIKASTVQGVAQAESMLGSALGRLFAVAEAYPELKADGNFRQLQDTLTSLESEIQMARRFYNGTARDQNNRTMQFPGNIVAGMFGFQKLDYFELDDASERAVPEVKFGK